MRIIQIEGNLKYTLAATTNSGQNVIFLYSILIKNPEKIFQLSLKWQFLAKFGSTS